MVNNNNSNNNINNESKFDRLAQLLITARSSSTTRTTSSQQKEKYTNDSIKTLPVSKIKYSITRPITAKEERQFKYTISNLSSSTINDIDENNNSSRKDYGILTEYYKFIASKIELLSSDDSNNISNTIDDKLNAVYHIEIPYIALELLKATYPYLKIRDYSLTRPRVILECDRCSRKYFADDINKLKIKYDQFKLEKKITIDNNNSNNNSINENETSDINNLSEFDIVTEHDIDDNNKLIAIYHIKLPTAREYLDKIRELQDYIELSELTNLSNQLNSTTRSIFAPKIELLFPLIKSIELKLVDKNDNNNIKQEELINNHEDILSILDQSPVSLLEELSDRIFDRLAKIVPIFVTDITCDNCGSKITITLAPELNLLERLLS